ncbi:MAG: hypothetical protein ISS25_00405 [Nanoarchaeota archaeon]|nr:hypothetical protein [DPANN group archaeon]MBL7116278.1 hypothetical protein [Nanoarchaeota archaeon]
MVKIPGFVYLLIGVVVAGYSQFAPNSDMPFFNIFFYIGIVFIFWGVVKMIFSPSKRREKTLEHQEKTSGIIFCPRCNAKNFSYSRFCHMCKYKLR